jgi:hypothetical protein
MEPDVTEFLKRVGTSLSIALVWLCINVTAAIVNDNAFIKGHIRLANVLFYIWFVVSTIALVMIYKKMWGKSFKEGRFYDK